MISQEQNDLEFNNSNHASLKQKIKSFQTSSNPFKKTIYISALLLWRFFTIPYRLIFHSNYRSLLLLKYFKKHDVHQISNYTALDRYPDLFSTCKALMQGKDSLKILSFGCSTGEEVFTLREYFPDAFIVGVDINKKNIKNANCQNRDNKIVFSYDIEKVCVENGPFDIIFALAVFQRTENRNESTFDSSKIYPFEKFNGKLTKLNSHLKPNGLFVIDHTDYLFEDSDVAINFHPLKGEHIIVHERYLFDRDNQKMSDYVMSHRIFIKKEFESFDLNS